MSNDPELKKDSKGKYFKYAVLVLLFLGWCVGNLDKNAISFAVTAIAKEFQLNASTVGIIMSAFFLGYAIMQLPGGYLADRFGAKKVLLVVVFVWSLFTGLTGIAWSFSAMVAFRFCFGLGEGSFVPTGTKMISQVFPRKEQGKAMSILLLSSAFIATIGPIIFASIMNSMGWRAMFYIIGILGVIIIILYFVFLKNADMKQAGANAGAPVKQKGILKDILKVPMVWSLFIAGFCATAIIWGLNAWIPTYLMKVRNLNLMQIGLWQMFPNLISLVALLLSGWIADKISTNALKITTIVISILMALSTYLMCMTTSLFMFFLFEGLALAFVSFIMLVAPKLIMKRFSPNVVGSSMGFVNFGSQIGSFTAPTVMGFLVDMNKGSFDQAFWYLVVLGVICAIAYITISKKSITSIDEAVAA